MLWSRCPMHPECRHLGLQYKAWQELRFSHSQLLSHQHNTLASNVFISEKKGSVRRNGCSHMSSFRTPMFLHIVKRTLPSHNQRRSSKLIASNTHWSWICTQVIMKAAAERVSRCSMRCRRISTGVGRGARIPIHLSLLFPHLGLFYLREGGFHSSLYLTLLCFTLCLESRFSAQ